MPQILSEDDFGTTVMDDGGRIVVLPRGTLAPMGGPGGMNPGAALNSNAPAPPPAFAAPPPLMAPDEAGPGSGPPPGPIATPAAPPPTSGGLPGWMAKPITDEATKGIERTAGAVQAAADMPAAINADSSIGDATNEVIAGYDSAQRAQIAAGNATAAAAQDAEKLLRDRNEKIRQIEEDRAKQIEADRSRYDELGKTQDAAVEAEAGFKIDENRRWNNKSTGQKVRATIGMILAGLGQALKGQGEKNPVIDMLQAEQARDVEQQMAEHDNLVKRIGIRAGQIDRFKQMSTDRVSEFNLRMATETERTARELEASAQQYASPQAAAAAKAAAAELRIKKGEYLENAKNAQWNRDLQDRQLVEQVKARKAQIGLGYANLKEGARQFDESMTQKQNEMLLDAAKLEQQGNIEQAKLLREQAKEQRSLAVGGKAEVASIDDNGNPVIRQQPLKTAAGEVWLAPDETTAREIRDEKGAVDTVAMFIDDSRRIIKANGGMSNLNKNADWQRLQANKTMISLAIAKANKMGAYDNGTKAAMDSILAGDQQTGYQSFIFDQGAGMEQARKNIVTKFNNDLRAANYDGEDYAPADTAAFGAPAETEAGKAYKAAIVDPTATERYAAEEPGVVTKALGAGNEVFGGTSETNSQKRAQVTGQASQDPLLGEITTNTGDQIRKLITQAKGGDLNARKALTALASDKREGLAAATLRAIGDDGDPKLMASVVSEMPESVRTARQSTVARASSQASEQARSIDLERRAMAGDRDAIAEVAQIASQPAAKGDLEGEGRRTWAGMVLRKVAGAK